MQIAESAKQFSEYAYLARAPETAKTYRFGMELFLRYLYSEGVKPEDDTHVLVPQYFISYPAYLLRRGYAKSTLNTYVAAVKMYYDWLVREDACEAPDYSHSLILQKSFRDAMKRRETLMPRFPKRGQAEQMVETAGGMPYESPIKERNYALVCFLYSSGCRNNEAATLKVNAFDFEDRSAVVTGKGSKQRRVFFNEETERSLREYWKVRGWADPNDPAFARHDRGTGKHHTKVTTTTIRNIVDEVRTIAGIDKGKFTPHYFRHSFAITVLRETANLALVQDLLGHESAESTRVYAKIYPEELRDAHHKIYH